MPHWQRSTPNSSFSRVYADGNFSRNQPLVQRATGRQQSAPIVEIQRVDQYR